MFDYNKSLNKLSKQMNILEGTDQIKYSFIFIVTPLEIKSTKSIKNLKKSLLLKLGDKTQKTSQLNKPIEIPIEVLYSKTLKKYCPIKGIIKVYDINSDGSEVISSVGGFQTEQILNEQKSSAIVQRDIGTSKVKMRIEIRNLGIISSKHDNKQKQNISQIQQIKSVFSRSRTRQNESQNSTSVSLKIIPSSVNSQKPIQQNNSQLNSKGSHYFKRSPANNIPTVEATKQNIIRKKSSSQYTPNAIETRIPRHIVTSSVIKINDDHNHIQSPQEQNKNQVSKNSNGSLQDIESLKKIIQKHQNQKKQTLLQFKAVSQCFQFKNSKVWIEFFQKLKPLSWKYKNKQFQKVFDDLFSFIILQLENSQNQTDNSLYFQAQTLKNQQQQVKTLNKQTEKTTDHLALKTLQKQKTNLQLRLKAKQRQIFQLEVRIKQLESFKKTLKQENNYLKEKDQTMQQIISQKQNQIQVLKQQITEVQLQFKQMQATIKNDSCQIQELRQQVSNLNEIIQSYRQKYGDLKNVKSRALQNQLKECLIWIDTQTRELQMSDFAEQTEPSYSHNVSQIIKNIELQGASREQMNSIKEQLACLIKRIDNFLAK